MPSRPLLKATLKKTIKKPKPLRSNPTRYILVHVEGNEDGYSIDDENIYVGYRRPEVVKDLKDTVADDEDLSDYVKTRLFLARQLALMKAMGYDLKTRI
jgi:hypothetical protein